MRKSFLLIAFVLGFCLGFQKSYSQNSPSVAIVLNEYCTSNVNGPADYFGVMSDWVELLNIHTNSVSLNGYYLSNDRYNLKKWAFPSYFTLNPGQLGVVWLSGRNTPFVGGQYHANFTLDQCKGQWLILSTSTGVIRDSVFIQKTKPNHTRGRIKYNSIGQEQWRLYTTNSQALANPSLNYYKDYLPTPKLVPINAPANLDYGKGSTNTGFFSTNTQGFKIVINNKSYDTLTFPCFNIYYTTTGDYPIAGTANTNVYYDSVTPQTISPPNTQMIRVIATPVGSRTSCVAPPEPYLESFCETNTYFVDALNQNYSNDFGVLSLALDYRDTSWFNSGGNPPSTTVHVEYYDKQKQVCEGYGLLNRPVYENWRTAQRGFNITIDDRYGYGCNFEGNIFNVDSLGASKRKVFPTLSVYGGDNESDSAPLFGVSTTSTIGTGIRDIFLQSLAITNSLSVNALHIKPIIFFVNGAYWGVFNLKEVFDKHYENYYNKQSKDSLDMCFYYGMEGNVGYNDGSFSNFGGNFKSAVYDRAINYPLNGDNNPNYISLFNSLDKKSFIDYMILNSFFMNSDLWSYNIAFAKGGQTGKAGDKYHYYLWNMPGLLSVKQYSLLSIKYPNLYDYATSACFLESFTPYPYKVSPRAYNGHGNILYKLMGRVAQQGNTSFQLEYKNRYQDLLNGPLSCSSLSAHLQYIQRLYYPEIKCHEDPGCNQGKYTTTTDNWKNNMLTLDTILQLRCYNIAYNFTQQGCYVNTGPYNLTIRIEPDGAGDVKVNSLNLKVSPPCNGKYPCSSLKYYNTKLSFKAIPTNTNYVFHHWKFTNHVPLDPISKDSVAVNYDMTDDVTAVFTDLTKDIMNSGDNVNIPTAFSPNGDGNNDFFKPLGSANYMTEYSMTIWNRWGQQVFQTSDPTLQGWDGYFEGQQAVTGVYAYIITYKNSYGEHIMVKGNVTLTR